MAEMNLGPGRCIVPIEKHRVNEDRSDFPKGGQSLSLPLQSSDKREQFLLDLSRGRIDLHKVHPQNWVRQVSAIRTMVR